jgi:hypothetical protein
MVLSAFAPSASANKSRVVTWDHLPRRSALYFAVVTLRRSTTGALLTFGPEGPSRRV